MEDTEKFTRNGERGLIFDKSNGVLDQASSPLRREAMNRSSFTMKSHENDEIDLEGGKSPKDRDKATRSNKVVKLHNQALLSGIAYCISSCSMILVNKFVLSSYDFNAGIFLMLYQNLISVIIVSMLSLMGLISTEPLTWRLIKVWLPVNVLFVGMLITSMLSLKYINVAMVTVLKNVTNVITALGEMYLFNKHHDNRVWTALFLMIISAISGGITDLSFHAVGYAWQILNCFLTASYSVSTYCEGFDFFPCTSATLFLRTAGVLTPWVRSDSPCVCIRLPHVYHSTTEHEKILWAGLLGLELNPEFTVIKP